MPADWPDESDGHPDRRDDTCAASHPIRPSRPESDPSSRQEEYVNLRIAVSTEQAKATHQTAASERAAAEKWNKNAAESRWMWSEYQRRWPEEARPQADHSGDLPGSWRGEGDRSLEPSENSQIDATCNKIAQLEWQKFTPAILEIESQDPSRQLVGLEDRLKGRDRIKEKACDKMEEFGFSVEQAVSEVSDVIRYTFQYREATYTEDFWADIGRLKDHAFDLLKVSNSWSEDSQYKGINSQWIDSETGQRFEVQFHTQISFDAKQLTHRAYERVRTQKADIFEELVLEAFQKKVAADVPVPRGATDIPDYP